MLGGKYTYAQVPLGFWMERVFGFTRNNYDRIGHFAQGLVPALVAREIGLVTLSRVHERQLVNGKR
jgi:putative membrane protein